MVSSALDTSVGLAAGVALAAALPELPYACGLGTMSLLAGDVTAGPLRPEAGSLPVRRPAVDPGELARWETDPAPWRERAARGRQVPAVNPSTAFGVTFSDELIRCGLREVVLAPGSRSTPLAMAFYEAARQQRLRLHVRIDERSASFTALGLAKASRPPVAVLCTSGTAAANFHPAVIEADESGVPLVVLTADRPAELRGIGANQAIDQIKLYGAAVRWFCEAGLPEARPGRGPLLALAGLPGLGARRGPRRRPARARFTSTCRSASRWCPAGTRSGQNRWTGAPAASRGPGSRQGGMGDGYVPP